MTNRKPLLYTNGQYTIAARHPLAKQPEISTIDGNSIQSSDDFIIPLLLRSYWEISDPFYSELEDEGIPVAHARILVHLSHHPELTAQELATAIRIDMASVAMSTRWLCDNGHLTKLENEKYIVSEKGLAHLNMVQSRAQRFEEEVLDGYSSQDVEMLKTMLRKMIYRQHV